MQEILNLDKSQPLHKTSVSTCFYYSQNMKAETVNKRASELIIMHRLLFKDPWKPLFKGLESGRDYAMK